MQTFKEMLSPTKPSCTLVSGLAESDRWMSEALVKLLRLTGRPTWSKDVGHALCIPKSRAERHLERLRVAGDIDRQRVTNGGGYVFLAPRPKPY